MLHIKHNLYERTLARACVLYMSQECVYKWNTFFSVRKELALLIGEKAVTFPHRSPHAKPNFSTKLVCAVNSICFANLI